MNYIFKILLVMETIFFVILRSICIEVLPVHYAIGFKMAESLKYMVELSLLSRVYKASNVS